MENRQYNLRSANRDTTQVPVQLQLDDIEFMSRVFDKNKSSVNDLDCDSNDPQSDLDCSGLLNLSNDDENSKLCGNDLGKATESGSHMQASTSSGDFSAQSVIDQQILEQLQNIGRKFEQNTSDSKKIKKK